MFADLIRNFLVPQIRNYPKALIHKFISYACGVVRLALGDVQDHHLVRREPEREGAGVVLDQDADEALERADDRAVEHHRRVARVVLADVLGAEPPGMLKSTCMVPHCQTRPMPSFSEYSIFGP